MPGKLMNVSEPVEGDAHFDFEFLDWPFYWLARADRLYLSAMERALAPIGLDIPRWRVLMVLHSKKEASVSEISDHSIVKLSTMTKIIQRMCTDGLVECAPSETDRRVTMVSITPKGEITGLSAAKRANRITDRVFATFPQPELDKLQFLLRKLTAELEF